MGSVTAETNPYSRIRQNLGPYINNALSIGWAANDTTNASKISFELGKQQVLEELVNHKSNSEMNGCDPGTRDNTEGIESFVNET